MNGAIPVVIERDNVNDDTVVLTRWFVPLGAQVESGQLIAEIETSKATVEIHSPAAGFIRYTAKERDEIPVGQDLCFIVQESLSLGNAQGVGQDSDGSKNHHSIGVEPIEIERSEVSRLNIPTSDSVQREPPPNTPVKRFSSRAAEMAKRYDLKPEMFTHRTLVREQDVRDLLKEGSAQRAEFCGRRPEMNTTGSSAEPLPRLPYSMEQLPARKRAEIRQIYFGMNNSIASSVTVACRTRGFRRALQGNPMLAGNAGAVVVFEVSRLLRRYPTFNAVYRSNAICVFDQVNTGFAVDDGRGLKVPVILECDRLALSEVSTKMRDLTVAYLEDNLSPEDLTGGTFTISDLAAFDVSHFSPLLSGDQSAILGVGSEVFLPGASSGLYHLTLVFDHQLSNGRTAALFLNELRLRLESYESALRTDASDGLSDLSCTRCTRSAKQLTDLGGCLLQQATPHDYICSLCILGY
jgi:pyruvate/2-oxoglutarate dehydrogenase complex dihydrolipoamide acyltransferase (E2) component